MYLVWKGIVWSFFVVISTSYSTLSLIPVILTEHTPLTEEAIILIGYDLLFLNLKSMLPYETVASVPKGT